MSAYIVSRHHVDALVTAAMLNHYMPTRFAEEHTPTELGRILWRENLRSVQHRYPECPDNAIPGPGDFRPDDVNQYEYQMRELSPVEVLKAIDCYEYQSCEHPDWETSLAADFTGALHHATIPLLPGYDKAAWDIEEPETAPATSW